MKSWTLGEIGCISKSIEKENQTDRPYIPASPPSSNPLASALLTARTTFKYHLSVRFPARCCIRGFADSPPPSVLGHWRALIKLATWSVALRCRRSGRNVVRARQPLLLLPTPPNPYPREALPTPFRLTPTSSIAARVRATVLYRKKRG